jgi:hypothetical protein
LTGATVGGFSGTVMTCGGGGGGAGCGAFQPHRGPGSWSWTPGVRPSPNVTFGNLLCPAGPGLKSVLGRSSEVPESRPDPTLLDGRLSVMPPLRMVSL